MAVQLKRAEQNMAEKLTNPDEGPINFNRLEARALRLMVKDMLRTLTIVQTANNAMSEYLWSQGLRLTSRETDGVVYFDIQNNKQEISETIN